MMKVKEYLRAIRSEQKELRILENKRETLFADLMPGSIRYDKDNIQISPSDQMPELVIKISELTDEINKHIEMLSRNKIDAFRMITALKNSEQRQVLILYYLTMDENGHLNTWEDVAQQMDYSIQNIFVLHGEALRQLRFSQTDNENV